MRNVTFSCDSCGETLERPRFIERGEHDCPDIVPALQSGTMISLRFELCAACLRRVVAAIRPNAVKSNQKLHQDGRTVGDVLETLTPYDPDLKHSSRQF